VTPDLLARYADRPLPRYTSYPTAPHFAAGIDGADYAAALAALPPEVPVSLYLHIPFCRSMCWYCGCHTTITAREAPVTRYLDALSREIDWVGAQIGHAPPARHVHFGGGTPSLMQPGQFVALMDRLRRTFHFDRTSEIAIELDPRTLTPGIVAALAEGGVTRASLGVQSFDPTVQRAINRVQSFAETAAATEGLRAVGIAAVNFDLIYGLPHQTLESCRDTVAQALTLQPDRFAVFGYAHVPDFKGHQRKIDAATLPNSAERHAQAEGIAEMLQDAGYVRIGIDHYARNADPLAIAARLGTLHRNFQGYTTDACDTLIGFGASSIGRMPNGYVQNIVRIDSYRDAIAHMGTAIARSCRFSEQDRLRGEIIERLMCDYRADLPAICARHDADPLALIASASGLDGLAQDGLITVCDGLISVAPGARPLVRAVAAAFDAYLDRGTARHSRAV
jgi:oxygen-independent coproporphyrinogen-3 oxidase